MDLYLFALAVGFGGMVLMALLGLSVGGHHAHSAGGGHQAHPGGGHSLHGHAPAKLGREGPAHAHPGSRGARWQGRGLSALFGLLTPRVLFSLLLGFGAAGTMLHPVIHWPLLLLAISIGAAIGFERLVIQPLWSFLLNFASRPAGMLDRLLLEEAKAASDFDRSGHGLVRVEFDGETRQILGTLCREEHSSGIRVRTGDRLFIRDIDGARNSCTVSYLSC